MTTALKNSLQWVVLLAAGAALYLQLFRHGPASATSAAHPTRMNYNEFEYPADRRLQNIVYYDGSTNLESYPVTCASDALELLSHDGWRLAAMSGNHYIVIRPEGKWEYQQFRVEEYQLSPGPTP